MVFFFSESSAQKLDRYLCALNTRKYYGRVILGLKLCRIFGFLISPRPSICAEATPERPLSVFYGLRLQMVIYILDLQFWNFSSCLPANYRANGEIYDKFVFLTALTFRYFYTGFYQLLHLYFLQLLCFSKVCLLWHGINTFSTPLVL